MKRIICVLLTFVMLIGMIPPLEVHAAAGPAALTTPKITPKVHDASTNTYVGYYDDEVSCSSSLKVRWKDVDADSYNVAVKVLSGEPNLGDNEPTYKELYAFTTGYTKTDISLTQSQMKSAAGKWVKVFVQSVFGSKSYSCHYYFRVAELGEPAPLTNPEIDPESHSSGDYVGYYDDEVSNASSLRVRWEDVDADSYNVAIKVLNGEPDPGDSEPGTDLYKYTTGYTRTYISLTQAQIESAAGKWVKVFVASVFGNKTFNCHYYFKVEALKDSFNLNKTSVSLAWGKTSEGSVQITGASSYSYDVKYDVPASVTESGFNYEWLNVTKTGSGLTFTPNRANYAATARKAVVTVTAGGESKTVTVTQAACGEAAPTIQLHRGSTVYADGDTIGSFLMPQEAMDVDITATNVRKVTANLYSSANELLDSCTSTSRITLDISNVPAGQYKIVVYASNSDTPNDYWKQNPFTTESVTLNFRLIDPNAVGSKDFASFTEARKMVNRDFSTDWSTVGEINGVIQYLSGAPNCEHYYTDDNAASDTKYPRTVGYWKNQADANGSCTRASASMAFSYLGITAFPKNIASRLIPYETDADKWGCDAVKVNTITLKDFNTWYERYANDTTGKYSPVVLYTEYNKSSDHAIVIFGRDINDGYYYVADPGNVNCLGKIKLVEVEGAIRVADYINVNGQHSTKYNDTYSMNCVWQYIKRDAPDAPVSNLELSQNAVNMTWSKDNRASVQVSGVNSFSVSTAYSVPADIQNSEYDYSWLNCERAGNTLTLTPNRPNYAATARTATVTVTSGSQSKTITVTQAPCGEAVPTIKLYSGSTVYTDGSSLGTLQLPAEVKISIASTNVRKVTAYLKDAKGDNLAECTSLSGLHFDVSSLPAGNYQIIVYASNSDTNNDYWKQSPFTSGSATLNFELAAAHTHSYASVVTKPTCTEEGYTTHTCSCGDRYVDSTVAALGHSWDKGVVTLQPTETSTGIKTFTCTVCKETKTEIIPVLDHVHSYDSVVTKPTCTEEGYTTHTCSCGDRYVDSKVPVLGHAFGEWGVEKAAACEEEGLKRRDCTRCDVFETIPIAKLGHSFTGYVSNEDATCAYDGTKTAVCDRCDVQDTLPDIGSRLPHSYGEWIVEKAATCVEKGAEIRRCINGCGASETREITELAPHSYDSHEVTEPTCTAGGYTTHICGVCGHSYVDNATDPIPHVDEDGNNLCDICESTMCAHSYDAAVTAPTCEEQGYTIYACTTCGHSYVGDYTGPLGHAYGKWFVSKNPSCEEDGIMARICANCDAEETTVIAATGHSEVADENVAATCEQDGRTGGSHCSVCGKTIKEATIISATGHRFGNWTVTKAATCLEPGIMTRTCHCGKTETTETDKLDHKPVVDAAKEATCTEPGLTEGSHCELCKNVLTEQQTIPAKGHTEAIDPAVEASCIKTGLTEGKHCSVCKTVLIKQEELPMTEHEYENGACVHCGAAEPDNSEVTTLIRIAGDGRCQTAMEAAEELKKIQGVDKFHTIVVADGNNYPDALSGSYLAAVTDAPILLVQANQKKVTQSVKDYIVGNLTGDGTVYILGGPNSIPADFENSIRNGGFTVKRLAGNDRYATSLMIVEEANALSNAPADTLLVCAGGGYADSLSASATGKPVLLVNGTKTSLTTSQKNYLSEAGKPKIYVIGGPNSVSDAILNELSQYGSSVKRIAGNGREETSASVAYEFFPDATFAVLADGNNYPDGLSGGPVAYAKKAPLLLIRQNREASAKDYVGTRIKNGYILGGVNSVSDASAKAIFGASAIIK